MSHGRPTAPATDNPAPETLEGWWLLHDLLHIDRAAWRAATPDERSAALSGLMTWLGEQAAVDGGSAAYAILGHKADLMLIHHRTGAPGLHLAEQGLRDLAIARYLIPATSYVSVAEASLYEATGAAHRRLAERGLTPRSDGFDEAFSAEIEHQKGLLEQRVFRNLPEKDYVCYYPMSKRRGEHENWYNMPLDERRGLMRGHGRLGRKYSDRVIQIIAGSTGLDDWEWSVDLHADDLLVFKKLVYEMRFDPASARFAEFGEFFVGSRVKDLAQLSATFGTPR